MNKLNKILCNNRQSLYKLSFRNNTMNPNGLVNLGHLVYIRIQIAIIRGFFK